jgi:hypothetical protein
MAIAKTILLGMWLASFGTIAYLYLAIYRKLPANTSVSVSVFEAYMTRNVFWWLGLAVCFGVAFMILRAWPGRPILWVALAVTELVPMGLVVMFLMLAARNREVIERMGGR